MTLNVESIAENIFTVDAKLAKNPIGRRMTIIQLKHNKLALHSPIYLNDQTKSAVDALGKVAFILVPNEWHSLDTKKVHDQYPQSKVIAPLHIQDILSKKCPIHGSYEKDWSTSISEELDVYMLKGLKKPEAVFFHKLSKTLIVADVFFNFKKDDFSGLTKCLMTLNKATQFGTTRLYQWSMLKDKVAFKASFKEITEKWDIHNIVMGHGHKVEKLGATSIKQALENI